MNRRRGRGGIATAIAIAGLALTSAPHADPDEAWLLRAGLPPGTRPLLALIIDTSAATADRITTAPPYDPTQDYGTALPSGTRCDPGRVYWRRGAGLAPDCAADTGLAPYPADRRQGLQCDAARAALAKHGYFVTARAAQWRPSGTGGHWSALRMRRTDAVECRADRGRHGASAGTWYATDGGTDPWGGVTAMEIDWNRAPLADPYIFYAGNFLNYLRATPPAEPRPVLDLLTQTMASALEATDELDIALLRVNEADGAHVARAPVAAGLAAGDLRQLAGTLPAGGAPLAEALAETAAWLSGATVRSGADTRADAAAFESPGAQRYRSPFTHACRPVTVAYLTAGQPSNDESAALAAGILPGFDERTGGCGASCLPALARWIGHPDLRDGLPGAQFAPLHWLTPAPAAPSIAEAASADAIARLDDPLAYVNLVARSLQHDAAVPGAPQLSAPALLTTRAPGEAAELVFGLSAPLARSRWRGNFLKYALRAPASALAPPTIVDRDGSAAIDAATGLPLASSRSLWSDAPDASLWSGGAAGRLPAGDGRRLHSDLATARILEPANRLAPGNPRVTRERLQLGAGDPESPDDVLAWLADARSLGDPGLRAPVIVDDRGADRRFVIGATQDGLLQAFDAASGIESWAWLPQELLPRLARLMRDEPTTVRDHGIDGSLVLHRFDPDGDGHIDPAAGEHQWLLFGLGRGGSRYYALDLASVEDPRLLWSVSLPGADQVTGQATPVITRLAIAGSGQSDGHWVVLLAGGYDRRFDGGGAVVAGAGNELLLLDAVTGQMLWRAGADSDADLHVTGMTVSLPSAPRALDLDGDGYLDRAYLVDVGGALWRMDFASGNTAGELARAHLLARLGTGLQRFHETPDVSVGLFAGRQQLAVAVGSGWLARPRDGTIVDRLYLLLDRPGSGRTDPYVEADLHDATEDDAMPVSAPGWYRRLERHGPGEKIIGPLVTFQHALRFQTYQPVPDAAQQPCGPPRAIRRLHAIDVRTGLPLSSSVEFEEDEADEEPDSGLPVALGFGFPGRWDGACDGCRARPFGIAGTELFDPGYAGDPVRTSWRRLGLTPDSR